MRLFDYYRFVAGLISARLLWPRPVAAHDMQEGLPERIVWAQRQINLEFCAACRDEISASDARGREWTRGYRAALLDAQDILREAVVGHVADRG